MDELVADWCRCAAIWSEARVVNSGEVGPVMAPSREHLLCEQFAGRHPEAAEFLIEKLREPDPNIAAYAFKCLIRVRELKLSEIPPDVLERRDPIKTLWGCVVRTCTLGDYIKGYWGSDDPEPATTNAVRRTLP